jgi:hypothetical protein
MLFDREEKRFARVQRSVPGYLKIVYLSGGDREYGTLDVIEHLKDQGANKRVSELAEQLGLPDIEVLHELERLGITPLDEPDEPVPPPETPGAFAIPPERPVPPPLFARITPNAVARTPKGAAAAVVEDDDGDRAEVARPLGGKAPHKPSFAAKPAPARALPAARAAQGAKPSSAPAAKGKGLNGTPAVAKGSKGVNPIDDPNGYIKVHYQGMSNRELARLTGLSEHTIRRKLGEWSLKRKRE